MPRFSVVVPTRDRPHLLEFCLGSLAEQTLDDVEVVVSDNPVHRPAREVFDRFAGPGWRYFRPEQPVAMHDNFERGMRSGHRRVRGRGDRQDGSPSVCARSRRVGARARPRVDIVNWWNEGYDPLDESLDLGARALSAFRGRRWRRSAYDPHAELARRFLNEERRGVDPVLYFRGKIVFGAYSRRLLERIRAQAGRVFHPLAADYTSMVPACVLARRRARRRPPTARLVQLEPLERPAAEPRPGARSPVHRGHRSGDPRRAADPAALHLAPQRRRLRPRVVRSSLPSRDHAAARPRQPGAACARGPAEVVWTDEPVRGEQYGILEAAEARLGVEPQPPRAPRRAGSCARSSHVRPWQRLRVLVRTEAGATYSSPLEAARGGRPALRGRRRPP